MIKEVDPEFQYCNSAFSAKTKASNKVQYALLQCMQAGTNGRIGPTFSSFPISVTHTMQTISFPLQTDLAYVLLSKHTAVRIIFFLF